MFSTVAFGLTAFLAALILTLLVVMVVPFRRRDEVRPGKTFAIIFALTALGPFAFCETLTLAYGKSMEDVADEGYTKAGLTGEIRYYKVVWYTGSTAKLLVIGAEPTDWGTNDRPSASVQAIKEGDHWVVEVAHVINSDKKNLDGIRIPPYW